MAGRQSICTLIGWIETSHLLIKYLGSCLLQSTLSVKRELLHTLLTGETFSYLVSTLFSSHFDSSQSLRELILKNEFVETNDKYPATHTHAGTQKQLTVKSKRSGFWNKWHISIKKSYKSGF